jgi:hypothetical protein
MPPGSAKVSSRAATLTPVHVLALGDDLAETDAHAKFQAPVGSKGRIPLRHGLLDIDGALNRLG